MKELSLLAQPAQTLDQLLTNLSKFGQVTLSTYTSSFGDKKSGWHCTIDVNFTGVGGRLEFKSELFHPTPLAAARQCAERMVSALSQIKL